MKDNRDTKEFITFTKAARLLGYTSSQIINRLIEGKHLRAYSFPDSSTRKVCRKEVLSLIQLSVSKDSLNENKTG
jgi:hypothetical protein